QLFQAASHPLALGRRLDQDLRPRPLPQHRRKPLSLRPDPPLDHLTALRQDADLAFHFVHVDANMLHGWPPPLRHTTACTIVGLRPPRAVAASRFIPSIAVDIDDGAVPYDAELLTVTRSAFRLHKTLHVA